MPAHSSLTGTNLHPAFDSSGGANGATSGQIPVANGSNGAVWTDPSAITSANEYATMYTQDGSTAQASVGTTPVKITGFAANGPNNVATVDHTTDTITLTTAGVYLIMFQISYTASVNSTTWQFHPRLDAVEGPTGVHRKIGTGTDVGSASFMTMVTATAGQALTMYVEADSTSDFTPIDMQLSAVLLKAS